jgi:hypothetical protein
MHIRSTYPVSTTVHGPQPASAKSLAGNDPVGNAATTTQTVTISEAARQAADAERATASGRRSAAGIHPLEMYQVPGWYADYGFEVTGELGSGANGFTQKYPEAAAASSSDRAEYMALVQGHYQALLDANGIHDVKSHYDAMIADRETSESLRQQFVGRIQSDARLLELMGKVGKA